MTEASTPIVGWREWLSLPDFQVDYIKVKVDTGARTSALHAKDIRYLKKDGQEWVRFVIHPRARSRAHEVAVEAAVIDHRSVRSSTGQSSVRPVIETTVKLGDASWAVELTLVDRDLMGFRMLLGRQALRRRFLVSPGRSFLIGQTPGSQNRQ